MEISERLGTSTRRLASPVRGPRSQWIALALLVAAYVALSLSPFDFTLPAQENAAERGNGYVTIAAPGVLRTSAGPAWVDEARRRGQIQIALRVLSYSPAQSGPARIFTISADTRRQNLMIGQDRRDLVLRLRTPWSDDSGNYEREPLIRAAGVLEREEWLDIAVRIDRGRVTLTAAGKVWRRSLPMQPFTLRNWNPDFRTALGNELTNDRPWRGSIAMASVTSASGTVDLLAPGALARPGLVWRHEMPPQYLPTLDYNFVEGAQHFFGYIPLGVLLAVMFAGLGGRRWALLLPVAVFGVIMEALQFFVPTRQPSMNDALFNVAGAAVGMALTGLEPVRKRLLPRRAVSSAG